MLTDNFERILDAFMDNTSWEGEIPYDVEVGGNPDLDYEFTFKKDETDVLKMDYKESFEVIDYYGNLIKTYEHKRITVSGIDNIIESLVHTRLLIKQKEYKIFTYYLKKLEECYYIEKEMENLVLFAYLYGDDIDDCDNIIKAEIYPFLKNDF